MLSVGKPASLVQQKKQQWAREREEMSHLYLPWGSGERYTNRIQIRNQFASSLELHKQSSYEYQEPIQRQRSPSLPPIRHADQERIISKEERRTNVLNRNIPSAKRFSFYDEDAEGDTSGYGSETVNHMNRSLNTLHDAHITNDGNPVVAWQQNGNDNRNHDSSGGRNGTGDGVWSARSPRSNTAEEGRPRWGDRGVATGRLWEPTAPNARLPQMQNQKKGTPSWVERGLNMIENTAEVLVIDQTSSTNSCFDCDRSSCNGSDEGRTFLRGQNVPLEPEIKAQRENKRIKALELQSAILSQLEDREKRRQEERERRLREERLEELRIQRQQEEDRLRIEEEKRKNEEKQLMEQRKLETLKKALEDAEKKARQEKEKRFISHRQNLNSSVLNCNVNEDSNKVSEEANTTITTTLGNESMSPTKTNRTYDVHSPKSQKKDCDSQETTEFNSPRSMGPSNLNLFIHSVPPLALADSQFSIVPIGINGNGEIVSGQPSSLQLAVLVPQNLTNNLYSVSLNSLNNISDLSDSGKVLTPRKYRTGKTKDVSTQTEASLYKINVDKIVETEGIERNIDKDYPNIDENAPQENHHNTLKKDRRFRSEERFKKDIENRPKWGVNRPAAQYKKQSEKDPFYSQKRKMRQKYRPQARQYLSQSSEDSRSPSPPVRSEKTMEPGHKQRNSLSQSYWKNKRSSQDLSKNNNILESIDPITAEFNQIGQITANEVLENKKSPKMSPTKRMTLSQKFINDKYGNRKLWIDDVNERNTKCNIFDVENRKKIIDQLNVAKRDYLEKNEDQENLISKNKISYESYIDKLKASNFDVCGDSETSLEMSKLDDLFDKKKDEAPILDLSKTIINTAEEYRAVLDKVPDFKTRPEKVKAEDIKIKDKTEDLKTKTPKKEIRAYEKLGTRGYEEKEFTFMDPIPAEMRGLKFDELCAVPIDWKMLTSIRPKSKHDEEYFNRLIELGKAELRTRARDKREMTKNTMIRKIKNRSGVTETRILTCPECGEEYCNGKMCIITNYDMFARLKIEVETKTSRGQAATTQAGGGKMRRMKKRSRRKPRSKSAAPIQRKTNVKSGAKSDSEL